MRIVRVKLLLWTRGRSNCATQMPCTFFTCTRLPSTRASALLIVIPLGSRRRMVKSRRPVQWSADGSPNAVAVWDGVAPVSGGGVGVGVGVGETVGSGVGVAAGT